MTSLKRSSTWKRDPWTRRPLHISGFINRHEEKISTTPIAVRINHETSVIKIEHTISGFPTHIFSPLNFRQLIESATVRTYLLGINRDYPESRSKLLIGLLLNRLTMVKLTLWDNEASLFRQLQGMSNRKYNVVLVTSIISSICKGKLLLASSSATRFFFDETINHISGFRGRIRISNGTRGRANRVVPETAKRSPHGE